MANHKYRHFNKPTKAFHSYRCTLWTHPHRFTHWPWQNNPQAKTMQKKKKTNCLETNRSVWPPQNSPQATKPISAQYRKVTSALLVHNIYMHLSTENTKGRPDNWRMWPPSKPLRTLPTAKGLPRTMRLACVVSCRHSNFISNSSNLETRISLQCPLWWGNPYVQA